MYHLCILAYYFIQCFSAYVKMVHYIRLQLNLRRQRGLVSGTDDQIFSLLLARKFRALYDRILLPLSSFVVRPHFQQYAELIPMTYAPETGAISRALAGP